MLAQISQSATYILETYGLTGAVIIFLVFGLWWIMKTQIKERDNWQKTDTKRVDAILDMSDKQNKALADNTGAIKELKGVMTTINGKLP